jgi:hypothetical protein
MPRSPELARNRTVINIFEELRKPPLDPDTGWIKINDAGDPIAPPFLNSWSNIGDPYPPLGFYYSHHGECRLRGHITGGAVGTTIFLLPEEFRPQYTQDFIVPTDDGGYATIRVQASGEVLLLRVHAT